MLNNNNNMSKAKQNHQRSKALSWRLEGALVRQRPEAIISQPRGEIVKFGQSVLEWWTVARLRCPAQAHELTVSHRPCDINRWSLARHDGGEQAFFHVLPRQTLGRNLPHHNAERVNIDAKCVGHQCLLYPALHNLRRHP